jgi:hypothetical protein
MKRNYKDGIFETVDFFVGTEIEKTPAFGMKTLFVVGIQEHKTIKKIARKNKCKHIYFGSNQSFKPRGVEDTETWSLWKSMINSCLDTEDTFWCTLDFDVSEVEGVLESGLTENRRFIPQISVKLPYINQLGYNATLKIDDKDFGATNPGVWCHNLQDLLGRDRFTDWDQYGKDEILK